ncbi:MAG: non-homologous end-joining DNA ligase, partial [Acidobacteriota bacterium]
MKTFRSKLHSLVAEIEKLSVSRTIPHAGDVAVMKPETRERPFTRPGWLFELKYDGFRMLAERRDGQVRLLYRSGRDATAIFPELAQAMAALPCDLILDGEAVVLDEAGRPAFQLLQRRAQRTRQIDVEQAAVASPAVFFAFDLLAFEGYDLRPLPLSLRKDLLQRVLSFAAPAGPLRNLDAIPERGEDLYAAVQGLGLEGIVAKRADSPYRSGYSPEWVKVRVDQTADFAILGFEAAPGSRTGFRNLHLGLRKGDGWTWAGTVGTGFDGEEMREIRARLEPARRPRPAAANAVGGRGVVWVEPEQVCEVRYKEHTLDGHLRQPVFLRLRDDKRVEECVSPFEEEPEEAPAVLERGPEK